MDSAKEFAKLIVDGFDYNPGTSDLDDERPIRVRMKLRDYHRTVGALILPAAGDAPHTFTLADLEPLEELAKRLKNGVRACCPKILLPSPKSTRDYGDVHQSCIAENKLSDELTRVLALIKEK